MQMLLRICSLRGCKGNFAQVMKITFGEINPFFSVGHSLFNISTVQIKKYTIQTKFVILYNILPTTNILN